MIILIILELLCIIPLTIVWLKADKNIIDEEFAIGIHIAFLIIVSIINWFCYGADPTGPIIQITSGIFEGDLNILGLILTILPPLFSSIISYIIFLIIIKIKYIKIIKKEKE